MGECQQEVEKEVEDIHVFFVEWFTGTADRESYEDRFVSRFDTNAFFTGPDGVLLEYDSLMEGMRGAHGTNPDFRIAIRDVVVRHESADQIIATYTEWQMNAVNAPRSNNGRQSTAVLNRGNTLSWLSVQETWLPEEMQEAGPYNF